MKKFLSFVFLTLFAGSMAASLGSSLEKILTASKSSEPVTVPLERQAQNIEKEKFENEQFTLVKEGLDKSLATIKTVKNQIEHAVGREREFLTKKLALLNQGYQVLTDADHVQQSINTILSEALESLQEYKEDADFKKLLTEVKTVYDYNDLEFVNDRIIEATTRLEAIEKNKISAIYDGVKRKKGLALIQDEYREKKKQQEQLGTSGAVYKYEGDILDESIRLLDYKKILAELKIKEADYRQELVDLQLTIHRAQLAVLKKEYARIKKSIRIDQAYLASVKKELEEKRQALFAERDTFQDKVRVFTHFKDTFRKRIEDDAKRFHVPTTDLAPYREWNKEPRTRAEWEALSVLGNLITQEELVESERAYIEAKIGWEKTAFKEAEIASAIVKSWYKMTQRTLGINFDREIEEEVRVYESLKAELQADLLIVTSKRDHTINVLHSLNRILEKIKSLQNNLKKQHDVLFRGDSSTYQETVRLLAESEDKIRNRLDILAQVAEKYSATMAIIDDVVKKIESVIGELSSKGFWRRSYQSIDWSELRNFVPDVEKFHQSLFIALKEYFSGISLSELITYNFTFREGLHMLFMVILYLIIFFGIFLLVRECIAYSALCLRSPHRQIRGIWQKSLILVGIVAQCAAEHLFLLYTWVVLCFAIDSGMINRVGAIVFYLISIPYSIYIIYMFMRLFTRSNQAYGHMFMSQAYQDRFMRIIPYVLYIISGIFFFREAFILGDYGQSQVPTMLLALIFILCQIGLISLISKEQVLSVIPNDTPLWEWVHERVDYYYYVLWLMVITVIVMSNPYVGYGHQVLYIATHFALTALVIPLFFWIHSRIRSSFSDLFFYYGEGELVKERFGSSKTWYGFFVVATFACFIVAGSFIVAYIWGKPFGFTDIYHWLTYPWYTPVDESGKLIYVSTLSLFQIVIFVVGGITVSYIINQFVLRRVFDPLLVGSGVQNTILTLTKYLIIFIAIFMGLSAAGLDGLTTKFAILIAGIGWAAQESVRDFFSYFVILVQRPIKIGDLIQIDNDIMGVVRHITPRSVILRRRNSVTILVPNSYIVMKPVTNWNFTRNFFAFEDIILTVPYSTDPAHVKLLILQVLDANRDVLKNPAPIVWLNNFVDNGYQFLVRGFLTADKVLDQWEISSMIRLELVRVFREHGIEVASPTRLLRMLSESKQISDKIL